ncbi:MAG: SMP-30/gluconolactonase/LRE family protein [Xanthomonadales bacterium]|jgi:gluconolactonase|nr:SMP-30/gluconolactonase/LRE family protein [Xanthomonadales bacterium]
MSRILFAITLSLSTLLISLSAVAGEDYPEVGDVQRFSPDLDNLLAPGAVIQRLTGDAFQWSEGPVWVPGENYVLLSDVPTSTVWKWSEHGGLEAFMKPSALEDGRERDPGMQGTNGLVMSLDGKLLAADHGSRSLYKMDLQTMKKTMVAGHFDGKRFNSPNDLALSRIRWPMSIFFTDPPYGLKGQDESPLKELEFNGVYRFDRSGTVTLLDDSIARPNGIGLSLDEKTLYVANSQKEQSVWLAFDLDEKGNVKAGPRLFASAQKWADEGAKGLPDGMAVDVGGNLWATGPGGVFIIDPHGKILGLIQTGTAAANCAFGGEDGSMLYITSHKFLARIKTRTKGIEFL